MINSKISKESHCNSMSEGKCDKCSNVEPHGQSLESLMEGRRYVQSAMMKNSVAEKYTKRNQD